MQLARDGVPSCALGLRKFAASRRLFPTPGPLPQVLLEAAAVTNIPLIKHPSIRALAIG